MKKSAVLLLSLLGQALFAKDYPSYQPENFELSGLKLGMTVEETQKALQEHFPNSKIHELNDSHPENRKIKIPTHWSVKGENQKVVVYFQPNYLNGKGDEIVISEIMFAIPRTDENRNLLEDSAINKYGHPTIGKKGTLMRWCAEIRKVGFGENCDINQDPTLSTLTTLSGEIVLHLQNPQYKKAIQEALQKKKNVNVKELKL